jgi:hypothetical protein
MRRIDIDAPTGASIEPPRRSTVASHDEAMYLAAFDHSQLKVMIERGVCYWLPISSTHFVGAVWVLIVVYYYSSTPRPSLIGIKVFPPPPDSFLH